MHELLTERPDLFESNNQMSFYLNKFHPSIIDDILLHDHNQNNHLLLNEISRLMGYKGNFTRDIGIANRCT